MPARRSLRRATRVAGLAGLALLTAVAVAEVAGSTGGHPLGAETPPSLPSTRVTAVPSPGGPTVPSGPAPQPSPPPAPHPRAEPPANPPPANPPPASPPPASGRDAVLTGFAARRGFTLHLVTMPGYRGPPAYASTDMRSCQVWVGPRTTQALAMDVIRHEYLHVLACRDGTRFATPHFEHVADAGAALQGARHAFYGAFTRDDTLEARRLLATAG